MEALTGQIANRLRQAVDQEGEAVLAVSGGKTPGPLFDRLAATALPWGRITVTLVDERLVATDDDRANSLLVRRRLLTDRARAARLLVPDLHLGDAETAARRWEQDLRRLGRKPDLMLLGMGADGHTASLFPGASGLAEALAPETRRLAIPVQVPADPPERLTLTLPAILDARRIFLLLVGETKRKTLQRALAGGPVAEMPVRGVLRQDRVPVDVFWAPDPEA